MLDTNLPSISERMSRASSCTDISSCFPMAPINWAVIFLQMLAVRHKPERGGDQLDKWIKWQNTVYVSRNLPILATLTKQANKNDCKFDWTWCEIVSHVTTPQNVKDWKQILYSQPSLSFSSVTKYNKAYISEHGYILKPILKHF